MKIFLIVVCLLCVFASMVHADACVVEVSKRASCGFGGISKENCLARNCCYNTTTPNSPWCYLKAGAKTSKNIMQ
ncbi:Trefoil factor 2 [Exaiptasia diaphana]|nr:Trefoil factor 2 [Exaiptasia diaphana]